MKRLVLLVLLAATTAAFAQAPMRVRGAITKVDGDVLTVKTRDGRDVALHLTSDAQVVTPVLTTFEKFPVGSYIGVTSVKNSDGKLVARRVHALGPQVPQMHGAWDSIPDSMMTNANVASMATVSGGHELVLKYKDGEQKIIVTPQTEYYTFTNGSRADLKPGATIFTGARVESDGRFVAARVVVSKDGVAPPQ